MGEQIKQGMVAVNDKVKMVLIASAAAVICVGLYLYFSPYQSCVRALEEYKGPAASAICARNLSGKD